MGRQLNKAAQTQTNRRPQSSPPKTSRRFPLLRVSRTPSRATSPSRSSLQSRHFPVPTLPYHCLPFLFFLSLTEKPQHGITHPSLPPFVLPPPTPYYPSPARFPSDGTLFCLVENKITASYRNDPRDLCKYNPYTRHHVYTGMKQAPGVPRMRRLALLFSRPDNANARDSPSPLTDSSRLPPMYVRALADASRTSEVPDETGTRRRMRGC